MPPALVDDSFLRKRNICSIVTVLGDVAHSGRLSPRTAVYTIDGCHGIYRVV